MSTFKKFSSIENDYKEVVIEYFDKHNLLEGEWYATEKIHGTNFSAIVTENDKITYCKRSMPIQAGTSFIGHLQEVYQIEQQLLQLRKLVGKDIQAYFEFYSGGKNIVAVGSIPYRNDGNKGFIGFDIRLVETDEFIGYPEVITLFKLAGLPHVQVLATGSFKDLMLLENNMDSELAKTFDVVTKSEGMVLKPFIEKRDANGDRVIIKRIADSFRENKKLDMKGDVVAKVIERNELIDSKITEIRLGKVAAKEGILPSEIAKFGTLINALSQDIFDEGGFVDSDMKKIKAGCLTIVKAFFGK